MIKIFRQWFHRYFSDPQAVLLCSILVIGFGLVIFFGKILAPVLAGIVFAYLLEGIVAQLQRWKLPRLLAVLIVFLGFLSLLFVSLIVLGPLIWKQMASLFEEFPQMISKGEAGVLWLSERYPVYFSDEQLKSFMNSFATDIGGWAKELLAASIFSITGIFVWVVYLVLVPLLIFFFLKDRQQLLTWLSGFLPSKRGVLQKVSKEVHQKIGSYIRGKVIEILLVAIFTYLVFWYFDLRYGLLLASLVGISCLIPYVGGVVVSIPVVVVAYMQWGWGLQFGYAMLFYSLVQILDANLLIPVLFSQAVNLHPVAIIVATLFFGGIWGFWGVFFAIPLATLVKAVMSAWPHAKVKAA